MKECPFRYQGQYEDEETGLYYNRFRFYEPNAGSYLSQDPIRLAGGNPTIYGYVHNSTRYVDIFGLDETFYRTMSHEDARIFEETGKVPATKETFISKRESFSSSYVGELFEIKVNDGTEDALKSIGVGDATQPKMAPVKNSDWTNNGNAFFKKEGNGVNIGLGKGGEGSALEVFNNNIISAENKITGNKVNTGGH